MLDDYNRYTAGTESQCRLSLPSPYRPSDFAMDNQLLTSQTSKKRYSSSWFYGQGDATFPTIEEQVELCRKIASQLVNDDNKESKGASMFYKRVKRAPKWVHQSKFNQDEGGNLSEDEKEQIERMRQRFREHQSKPLKLILDPREIKTVERLRKQGEPFTEHNSVSPDLCLHLVKDLNSPDVNKGAQIFLKRKEKSSEWVVNENKASKEIRERKERKEREESLQKPIQQRPYNQSLFIPQPQPRIRLVRSPWEAALETGSVENAFLSVGNDQLAQTVKEAAINKKFREVTNIESNESSVTFRPINPYATLPRTRAASKLKETSGCGTLPRNSDYDKNLYLARAPRGWNTTEPSRPSTRLFYQEHYYRPGTAASFSSQDDRLNCRGVTPDIRQQRATPICVSNENVSGNGLPHYNLLSFAHPGAAMPKYRDFNLKPKGFSRN